MGNCLGAAPESAEDSMLSDKTRVGKGARDGARLKDDFTVQGAVLGIGRMASVREAVDTSTGQKVAVKACSKKLLSARPPRISRTSEIEALIRVGMQPVCPHVVKLLATYEDRQQLYLVLDLAKGGDLFHHIATRNTLSENDVRHVVEQLLEATAHCHRRGVVHRDLKPENVMLNEEKGSATGTLPIMLVDFGSAAIVHHAGTPGASILQDFMGTAFYCAPEVWTHAYGKEADVWSIGAIMYVLLTGRTPSPGLNRATIGNDQIWRQMQTGEVPSLPSDVSPAAKGLLQCLLNPSPEQRISAEAAMRHPWISGATHVGTGPLEGSIRGIRSYALLQKLRKVALTLLIVMLDETAVESLISTLQSALPDDPSQISSLASEWSLRLTDNTSVGSNHAAARVVPGAPASRLDKDSAAELSLNDIYAALEAAHMVDLSSLLRSTVRTVGAEVHSPASEGVPLFSLTELSGLLLQHHKTVRSAVKRERSWKHSKPFCSSQTERFHVPSVGNEGTHGSGRGLLSTAGHGFLSVYQKRPREAVWSPSLKPRGPSCLPFSSSSHSMHHARSLLELSRAESDRKGISPAAPVPGNSRQSASVHGEQLYKSAFLSLGDES